MLKIIKQLEYIYSLQLLENKIKEIKKIYKYIPIIFKKKIKKIKNKKRIIKSKKKKILNYKNKILYYNEKKRFHLSLMDKYKIDKNSIINIKDLNILNKEIEYSVLKINYIDKEIIKINKKIIKIKENNQYILGRIKKLKIKNLILKNKLKKILYNIKKQIPKINRLLHYYKNKIKGYKIYKKFIYIKKKSKDNIGILSIYSNMAIENINLIIPKNIYYNLNKNNKIYYDYYTGKILISKNLSDKIKYKFKNIMNNILI
ncbi:MAG: hypothetical protein NHF92_01005 [Candidatus Shikimatogenerans bostrichidophilus]|nr:MAG: hypothetical protein NHF92_01005 [Candidatus Shikimatogenerans bostrichidophilus]